MKFIFFKLSLQTTGLHCRRLTQAECDVDDCDANYSFRDRRTNERCETECKNMTNEVKLLAAPVCRNYWDAYVEGCVVSEEQHCQIGGKWVTCDYCYGDYLFLLLLRLVVVCLIGYLEKYRT